LVTVNASYDPHYPVLLLSLHPNSTQAILAQTKILEYRRQFYRQPFQAFVYTTGSQGGVTLFIKCDQPIEAEVATLAQIGRQLQHDDSAELKAYFGTHNSGLAIPITEWVQIPRISLATLRTRFTNFVVPRSYVYLNHANRQSQLDYLLAQSVIQQQVINWSSKYAVIDKLLQHKKA